jgi:hypothetical protein
LKFKRSTTEAFPLAAVIGTLVGKSVVAHNTTIRSDKLVLLPDLSHGLIGIRISGRF